MITVTFNQSGNLLTGFTISGHSDIGEEGNSIVCAAVSSVAYMVANTITDIQHISADVTDSDGFMTLNLSNSDAESAQDILLGLRLHLNALSEQVPNDIIVQITEV